ncbi:MAG: transcriptional repressor [Candidatus Poribacteria bacterium]|nr:MAG: transcriptional repressor [Candidatus Poribacteria bacterium]
MEYLRRRGKKVTDERLDILREVLMADSHFEAEDLLIRMRQQGKRVSKATIYRTLPLLIEAGLLRQSFRAGEKQTYYENTLGPKSHEHMICRNCGKVIEFTSADLEHALEAVTEKYQFLAERRRIEIYGLCADCSSFYEEDQEAPEPTEG